MKWLWKYKLDHAITMAAMKCGLQKCPFPFSLEKRAPVDFSKMLAQPEKYMCIEEAYKVHGLPSGPAIKE